MGTVFTNNTRGFISYRQCFRGNAKSRENLNRGFRTKGISHATVQKIQQRCNVLNLLGVDKKVQLPSGQVIEGRLSFITLTLCSAQVNTDQFITKNLLSPFLDLCRKKQLFRNYVWRAEKQKNGNIHYHIVTDSLVDYRVVYHFWRLQLDRMGYLQVYTNKFSAMSFLEYCNLKGHKNTDKETLRRRYNKGSSQGWRNPNCTDVKYIQSESGVAKYISKYVSKDDNSENIVTGRIWGCSQEVTAALVELKGNQDFNRMAYELGRFTLKKEEILGDFHTYLKFSFKSLKCWFRWLWDDITAIIFTLYSPDLRYQME